MKRRRPGRVSGVGVIVLLLACLIVAETAVTQSEKSTPETQEPGTFRLTVSKGHLTLEANDASVVKIIKEIGKQTGIEVDIQIGSEEKITIGFDRVPLKDALGKIAENVTIFYTKDPNQPNFLTSVHSGVPFAG